MRTTLDIDDDILLAAKEMARMQGTTAGRVLSNLARKSLRQPVKKRKYRNGVPQLTPLPDCPIITTEMVNRWLDEAP
ncbi:MAG: CopG family transcriptional regulator [Bryobacterales bacterium]|nr:CopG family transcriptional regulator [Bryobacterales bacterium]